MSTKIELSPRYCTRCREEKFGEPGEHLCADLAKRLARRNRQVDAVVVILKEHFADMDNLYRRDAAEAIVQKLANLGVENDI